MHSIRATFLKIILAAPSPAADSLARSLPRRAGPKTNRCKTGPLNCPLSHRECLFSGQKEARIPFPARHRMRRLRSAVGTESAYVMALVIIKREI